MYETEKFSALENTNLLNSRKKLILLLYLGLIGVTSYYAFPSASIVEIPRSKSINLHDMLQSPNYMTEGDSLILDDKLGYDSDTKKTFILFLALAASLVTCSRPGLKRSAWKSPVNSFRYDSRFGYSPLRSPPSI